MKSVFPRLGSVRVIASAVLVLAAVGACGTLKSQRTESVAAVSQRSSSQSRAAMGSRARPPATSGDPSPASEGNEAAAAESAQAPPPEEEKAEAAAPIDVEVDSMPLSDSRLSLKHKGGHPSPASGGLGLMGQGFGGGARLPMAPRGVLVPAPGDPLRAEPPFHTEGYDRVVENDFRAVTDHPLSTFSIDVDTASYSNVRRFLRDGQLPPKDAVRIEELVNYFSYDYPEPSGKVPFSVHTEVSACPWQPRHRLVHVGLRGRAIEQNSVPPRNLVFLLDVSGSMGTPDKLPLLKTGMAMLTRNLRPADRVSIVVYAGASGLVLPPTSGGEQGTILRALDRLDAGGSTNGGDGIRLAYDVAMQSFERGGINRVILATDGDFNVGTTSRGELSRLIEEKRRTGVFLTVLGFGRGNVKDSQMESLADQGNGNYAYIDSVAEARKVLVREAGATLVTIAKDVKIQVEFNPEQVASYRLIGYENRLLAKEDFNDDTKDAGEIGAGHTVTALYEVVPKGVVPPATPKVDPLKYQQPTAPSASAGSGELLTVKLRYKEPSAERSTRLDFPVGTPGTPLAQTSDDHRFSVAVAGFGMLLRGSKHKGSATLRELGELARSAVGSDPNGDRHELLHLMDRARELGLGS